MSGRLPPVLILLALAATAASTTRAQSVPEPPPRLERHPILYNRLPRSPAIAGAPGDPQARIAALLPLLERHDRDRLRALERRYDASGNTERRLLERTFGVIQHRYRVDADAREIFRRWEAADVTPGELVVALEEIVEGRYAAYYFFDGVIRPNPFAPEGRLRTDSALHEKVHVIQPSVYRALGIRCSWRDARDGCVRSLEPVAVYLTEFAVLKQETPSDSDESVNRNIIRYLTAEAERCGYGEPLPRCPRPDQAHDYMVLPLRVADEVAKHGLEEGIRRFVRGAADPALVTRCVEPCGRPAH